jgi:hypothetical protein
MRRLMLFLALSLLGGCDPIRRVGIAVSAAPSAEHRARSQPEFLSRAFDILQHVSAHRGLTPLVPTDSAQHWRACFFRASIRLCGKINDGEPQFLLTQGGLTWSSDAKALRSEFLDSLRAAFGSDAVRECSREASRPTWGCSPRETKGSIGSS